METTINPRAALKAFVQRYPTQSAGAKALGISAPYLVDLLRGRRALSPRLLKRLGLRRVVVRAEAKS